ncbi:MAG: metallophosphoesterase [Armatimonadota bacterium]|nr:metallophosphoesterase [Armatimonadota bacterium]
MLQPPLFRFALLSDTHLTGAETAAPLEAAFRSLQQDPPDFAVLGGDMTDMGTAAQYAVLLNAIGGLCVPLRSVVGNHDRGNTGECERYRHAFGPLNTEWEAAGVHCLALDTTNTDPNPDNWHGMVEEPALHWLRQALARLPPQKPLLLFTHHGLVGTRDDLSCDVENAEDVLQLFAGRRLLAGFAGHAHRLTLNYWDEVPFFTAPALSCYRASYGVPPGFLRVEVFPTGVRVRLEIVEIRRSPPHPA